MSPVLRHYLCDKFQQTTTLRFHPSQPSQQMRFTALVRSASEVKATALSNVHRGNEFERRSLRLLRQNLSMSLTRVGGKADGGVDLIGWWWLPPSGCASSRTLEQNTDYHSCDG
jgi:hypothetical protein